MGSAPRAIAWTLSSLVGTTACPAAEDRSDASFGSSISVGTTGASTTTSDASSSSAAASDESDGSGGASTGEVSSGDTVDPATSGTLDTSGAATGETGDGGCPALGGQDCSPGNGSGEPDTCADIGSCFIDVVQSSVMAVIAAHPEWFDAVDTTLVLDAESYMNATVAEINAQGVCAIRDPNAGDEVAVKHDNAFAESFDILSADGHARYGELIYTATCTPAWF